MNNNNHHNGRVKVKYAILGGAIGGLISSLISSPQSQFYWWKKEPSNRWNIVLWDTIAISLTSYILGRFTKKDWLKYAGAGTLALGSLATYRLRKDPNLFEGG